MNTDERRWEDGWRSRPPLRAVCTASRAICKS